MMLKNATVSIDHLTYSNLNFDYLESNDEISVLIVGDSEAIINTYSYIQERELNGQVSLFGTDENGEKHSYELKNPDKIQFNLSQPLSFSIALKK